MKNPIPLLVLLLAITLSIGQCLYQKDCGCGASDVIPSVSSTSKTLAAPLAAIAIEDGSAFSTKTDDNLRFAQSDYEHLKPINTSLEGVFNKTAAYLKAHPDRSLKVTGYYTEGESNPSTFPTLGLARANDVKMILTSLGTPTSQIEMADLKFKQSDLTFNADTLIGGARYEFMSLVKNDTRLIDIEKRLKGSPIVLYFATNQSNLTLSDQQKQDFSDLQYYLEHKEGAKSSVTGHTDNIGNLDKNNTLSRSRADFIKTYMAKIGFPADKMTVGGKGPSVPISSNETAEGRSKNRRVEVGIE